MKKKRNRVEATGRNGGLKQKKGISYQTKLIVTKFEAKLINQGDTDFFISKDTFNKA